MPCRLVTPSSSMTQSPLFSRVAALSMGAGKARRLSRGVSHGSDPSVGLLEEHRSDSNNNDSVEEARNDSDCSNLYMESGRSEGINALSPPAKARTSRQENQKNTKRQAGHFGALRSQSKSDELQQHRPQQQQQTGQTWDSIFGDDDGFQDFSEFSSGDFGAGWDTSSVLDTTSNRTSTVSDNNGNSISEGENFINSQITSAGKTQPSLSKTPSPVWRLPAPRKRIEKKSFEREIYRDGISRAFLAKQQRGTAANSKSTRGPDRQAKPNEMFLLSGSEKAEPVWRFRQAGPASASLDEGAMFSKSALDSDPPASFPSKNPFTESKQVNFGALSVDQTAPISQMDVTTSTTSTMRSSASEPRRSMNSSARSIGSIDDLLAIKRELSDLKLWAKKKKAQRKKVQFAHPLITATNYRPKTEPEDIDKLFFNEGELLDWEEDMETTPLEHVECTIEQDNLDVQVEVALLL